MALQSKTLFINIQEGFAGVSLQSPCPEDAMLGPSTFTVFLLYFWPTVVYSFYVCIFILVSMSCTCKVEVSQSMSLSLSTQG